MKPSIYIETSVISYLAARDSNDVIMRGIQETTRQWWANQRTHFNLFTSQFVIDEAAAGDATAAAERLVIISGIDLLVIAPETEALAVSLLNAGALPPKARVDALHVALAAIHRLQYLMTWNCRHLANAALWRRIEQVCKAAGYQTPTICTPYELIGS